MSPTSIKDNSLNRTRLYDSHTSERNDYILEETQEEVECRVETAKYLVEQHQQNVKNDAKTKVSDD